MAIEIIDPNLLTVKTNLDGTEWLVILNPLTEELERALLANAMLANSPFISINDNLFRLIKNPNNNNPINKKTIEANDFVTNGFYNSNILIVSAKYSGTGSINDFGTYAGNYQDGSYTSVKFSRLT